MMFNEVRDQLLLYVARVVAPRDAVILESSSHRVDPTALQSLNTSLVQSSPDIRALSPPCPQPLMDDTGGKSLKRYMIPTVFQGVGRSKCKTSVSWSP